MAAVIVWIVLSRQGKEYALILSIGTCCAVLMVALRFFQPIGELLSNLQGLGNLQPEWLEVMLKAVGIGLLVEIGSLICADAGNSAMGKSLQIFGAIAVLWLSVPLMNSVMDLLQQILGGV